MTDSLFMSNTIYDSLIIGKRFGLTNTARNLNEEFTSDKNRIIFSPPFRRLQQKAQVFSLETNASVRSRLTHTLEVATIGVTIAEKIANRLNEANILEQRLIIPFIKIVENACLLHDLGNPPFGHFAEEAIKKWFTKYWSDAFTAASNIKQAEFQTMPIQKILINDFLHFDGNPQSIRIMVKLQDIPLNYGNVGMNLTYSQIASVVKYIATPNLIDKNNHLFKKAGYFISESEKIEEIKKELSLEKRYPLTYIMEAADDISYCLSDIEDGIEKRILTPQEFFQKLAIEYEATNPKDNRYKRVLDKKENKRDFFHFKIDFVRDLEMYAVESYINNHQKIIDGSFQELIDESSDEGKMLKCLKTLSRKYLFRSTEAENKELVGYQAIYGILYKYKCLLELEYSRFWKLVQSKHDINTVLGSGMDLEWRLFNRLPDKFIEVYKYESEECKNEYGENTDIFKQYEWFHRAHLIVDYISGMTDNYVLETYNLLYGIKI